MAEQKTEDTKPAVPRRVGRPFVGPPGANAGARPLLRPAAPADRPRPAAFGPPTTAIERAASLGTAVPVPVPIVVSPTAAVVHPEPLFEATLPAIDAPAPSAEPQAAVEPGHPELGDIDSLDAASPVAASPVSNDSTPGAASTTRPVTSEMVAIDAFDAFDAVWGASEDSLLPAAEDVGSPLDELSLGGGLDGPHYWTDEITTAPEQLVTSATDPDLATDSPADQHPTARAVDDGMPAWLADDVDSVEQAAAPATPAAETVAMEPPAAWASGSETEPATASRVEGPTDPYVDTTAPIETLSVEPASVEAASVEAGLVEAALVETVSVEAASVDSAVAESRLIDAYADARWPDPLLAEYAPYIPTPSSSSAIIPPLESLTAADPAAATSEAGALEAGSETRHVDSPPNETSLEPRLEQPAQRVSATLERLADRIRSGEIDVSSVAAEAPDAAVLASVLAALLGGSSSSR